MSHDIVKVNSILKQKISNLFSVFLQAISKQEAKDNFFFFNGVSCVGLSVAIGC